MHGTQVHRILIKPVYAGVAQLVARLLAMQKVCGFEPRHLLTVEQFTVKTQEFAKRVLCIAIEALTIELKKPWYSNRWVLPVESRSDVVSNLRCLPYSTPE